MNAKRLLASAGLLAAVLGLSASYALAQSAPSAGSVTFTETTMADMLNWSVSPATVTIQAGQSVTFTNPGSSTQPHTATAADGSWDTGLLQPGSSGSIAFATPGSYDYTCTPHPWMKGTIVVTAAADGGQVTTDDAAAAVQAADTSDN